MSQVSDIFINSTKFKLREGGGGGCSSWDILGDTARITVWAQNFRSSNLFTNKKKFNKTHILNRYIQTFIYK